MVLFLTSDVGASKKENGVRVVSKLNNTNKFIDELQKYLTKGDNFLFVASNPDAFEVNDLNIGETSTVTFTLKDASGIEYPLTLNVKKVK